MAERAALRALKQLARSSIDFDEVERERTERDGNLRRECALSEPSAEGNLYLLPSGRLVDADAALYRPVVVSADPASFFADGPGGRP